MKTDKPTKAFGGGWNYRVVRRAYKTAKYTEVTFSINEVYYDRRGRGARPVAITMNDVGPHGSSRSELMSDIEMMTTALAKPVLRYEDFEPGGKYFRA